MKLKDFIYNYRTKKGLSQRQLAAICGLSNSYIAMIESGKNPHTGKPLKPTIDSLKKLATGIGISLDDLLRETEAFPISLVQDFALSAPVFTGKVPRIGRVPCGEPNRMDENVEGYDDVPDGIVCDYTLLCEGDSMVDANIFDGDIVYIRQQPTVENGEIAAVWYDDATTLKRYYRNGDTVTLMPANPRYAPIFISGENLQNLRILGKAVGFTRIFK